MLVPGFESFVGMYPIPMRHGMTIGELARLFNDEFGIGADLEVMPMEGWRRDMYFDATGLTWIISSPNIPTLDTTTVYPGGVLFEGTNVSEGRGTTRPFELLGAPWVVAERFADAMNRRQLPGVFFRPALFEPTFHKHAGKALRRLPGPRARSADVPAGRGGRRADRSVPRQRSGPVPVEGSAVRIRARADADRLPRRLLRAAGTDRAGVTRAGHRAVVGAGGGARSSKLRERFLLY